MSDRELSLQNPAAQSWTAGTEYQAFCRSELTDPYDVLDELRRTEPVHWSPPLDAWVVTSYEEVVVALREPELRNDRVSINARAVPEALRPEFASLTTHLSNWLGFTDPPKHSQMREVARKIFNPASAAKSRPMIESSVREILKGMQDREHFDLMADLALCLPLAVICRLLGIPDENVTDFHNWAIDVGQFAGQVDPTWSPAAQSVIERANRSWFELEELFGRLIAEKRRSAADDILGQLVRAFDAGLISDDELIGLAVFILAAGHTTTRDLLGNGLYLLLDRPGDAAGLLGAPGNVALAIEEILRFESPIPMASRLAAAPVVLGDKTIEAGQTVILHLAGANRDEAKFEHANVFDVARQPNRHLAFGWGAHFCLGAPLAREQAAVVLDAMLPQLSRMQLGSAVPAWRPGDMSVRTLTELPVSWA
jgi:pimeloyl-[acyl-carrier protein] synthase